MGMWTTLTRPFRGRVQEFEAVQSITKGSSYAATNATVEIVDRDDGLGRSTDWTGKMEAVKELYLMYRGTASNGNQLLKNIVNYRIGMVFPKGVDATVVDEEMQGLDDDAEQPGLAVVGGEERPLPAEQEQPELQFIKDKVIRYNGLDGPGVTRLAKMRELEGQVAVALRVVMSGDEIEGIALDRIPLVSTGYRAEWNVVEQREIESAGLRRIVWKDNAGNDISIEGDKGVFIAFDALDDDKGKTGVPTCQGVIQELIDISRALRDLREGNQYFGKPSPTFQVGSAEEAARLNTLLTGEEKRNIRLTHWKVVHGKFELVGMDLSGTESLIKEVTTKAEIVSGGTGVPIQHLGFAELISNRGGLENTMEPVANFASTEQEIWTTFYQELFDKAIALANAQGTRVQPMKMDTGKVAPVLSATTNRELETIQNIKLPMAAAGQYPYEALRREVPSQFDEDELSAMLDKERAEKASRAPVVGPSAIPPAVQSDRIAAAVDPARSVLDEDEAA